MNSQKRFIKESGFVVPQASMINPIGSTVVFFSTESLGARRAPFFTSCLRAPMAYHFLFFSPWRTCDAFIFPSEVAFGTTVARHFPLILNGGL